MYCFIDEAQDYLKHEMKFKELQQKARKQNVALTIATHDLGDFDAPVQGSLKQMAFQVYGRLRPLWNVFKTSNDPDAPPTLISVPPFTFKDEPMMSEDEWQDILTDMRRRFTNAVKKEEPKTPPAPVAPAAPAAQEDEDWFKGVQ